MSVVQVIRLSGVKGLGISAYTGKIHCEEVGEWYIGKFLFVENNLYKHFVSIYHNVDVVDKAAKQVMTFVSALFIKAEYLVNPILPLHNHPTIVNFA